MGNNLEAEGKEMSKKPDAMAERKRREKRSAKNAAIRCIHKNVPKKEDTDLSDILGLVLEDFACKWKDSKGSPISGDIQDALEDYCGRRCAGLIPLFLKLHKRLMKEAGEVVNMDAEAKALLAENSYERTALPLLDFKEFSPSNEATLRLFKEKGWKHTPSVLLRKALILTEQSRHYVIVLEKEFGKWSIHVREWFASRDDSDETTSLIDLLRKTNDKAKQLDIVAKLVEQRDNARTDREGVLYPERLGIRAYINSNFVSGYVHHAKDACSGLLHGDYRDKGYVLSYRETYGPQIAKCQDAWVCLRRISCFFCYAYNNHETMKRD
jgi:hypothetical protein